MGVANMALYEFEGKRPQVAAEAFVHPRAVLIGQVSIGADCFIGAGAVLRADFGAIEMGPGSNAQENCVMHQSPDGLVRVGSGVIIGHCAILHDCTVGDNAFVGMGSILLPGVVMEEGAMLAAGAVASAGMVVPAGMLAAGNPAKVLKRVGAERAELTAQGRALYGALAARCHAGLKRID